jgi:hypothetical protein
LVVIPDQISRDAVAGAERDSGEAAIWHTCRLPRRYSPVKSKPQAHTATPFHSSHFQHRCRSPSPARPVPPTDPLTDGGGREGRFGGALPAPRPPPPPPPPPGTPASPDPLLASRHFPRETSSKSRSAALGSLGTGARSPPIRLRGGDGGFDWGGVCCRCRPAGEARSGWAGPGAGGRRGGGGPGSGLGSSRATPRPRTSPRASKVISSF